MTEEEKAQAWKRIGNQEGSRVRALGEAIGFGRLMQLAEQEWRKAAIERGDPPGGEFVSGVCRVMLDSRGFKSSMEMMDAYDKATRKLRKAKKKLKTAQAQVDGALVGVSDRLGVEVRFGDVLSFDEREWGEPGYTFVVRLEDGGVPHYSDIPQWCTVLRGTQ